jgi:hypothetical protein
MWLSICDGLTIWLFVAELKTWAHLQKEPTQRTARALWLLDRNNYGVGLAFDLAKSPALMMVIFAGSM